MDLDKGEDDNMRKMRKDPVSPETRVQAMVRKLNFILQHALKDGECGNHSYFRIVRPSEAVKKPRAWMTNYA